MVQTQFKENLGIMTTEEWNQLSKLKVLIVGCGGIGGNVANQLVRLGVQSLTLVDFDTFDETNLNRQLFSNHHVLKQYKVDVIKEALLQVNPNLHVDVFSTDIQSLDDSIIQTHDCMIDCVDLPRTKIFLNHKSTTLQIPLLHGSCAGWYSQVGWLEPGCTLLKDVYMDQNHGIEEELRNPPFTPSITASYMVSEFVKYYTSKNDAVINQLLLIDTKNNTIIQTGGR